MHFKFNPHRPGEYGRVEWVVQKACGSNAKKITYAYDLQGNVLTKGFVDYNSSSNNRYSFYEYDIGGRATKVYTGTDPGGAGKIKEAEYTYYPSSKVRRLVLGSAQGVDYAYNTRDWVTKINSENLGSDPLGPSSWHHHRLS